MNYNLLICWPFSKLGSGYGGVLEHLANCTLEKKRWRERNNCLAYYIIIPHFGFYFIASKITSYKAREFTE